MLAAASSASTSSSRPPTGVQQTIRIYDLRTAADQCKVPERTRAKWNALAESTIPTVHDSKDTRMFNVDIKLETTVGELFGHAGQKMPSWRLGDVITNPEAILGDELHMFTKQYGYAIDLDCVRYQQKTPFELLRVGTSIQRQLMALHAACSAEGLQGALNRAPHMFCCPLLNHNHMRDVVLSGASREQFVDRLAEAGGFYEYQDPNRLVHGADEVAIPHNLFAGVTRENLSNSVVFLNTTEVLTPEHSLIAHILKMRSCGANKVYIHPGSGSEKEEQFNRARLYALHCSMDLYNSCCQRIMERSDLVREYGSFIFSETTLHIAPPFKEVKSRDDTTVTLKNGAVLRYTDTLEVAFTFRIKAAYYSNPKAICTVPISVGFWEDNVWARKDYDFRSHSLRDAATAVPYPQSIDTVDKEAADLMRKYLAVAQLPKPQLQQKRTRVHDASAVKSIDDLPDVLHSSSPSYKGKEEATMESYVDDATEMEL